MLYEIRRQKEILHKTLISIRFIIIHYSRPPPPEGSALPDCATHRVGFPGLFQQYITLKSLIVLYHCCTPAQLLVVQAVNLTQSKVDKLQPKDKRYVVKDSGGLSVCVQPSGAKSFQLRYRFHGRQKTLSLGDISLKDARAKAQAARVAIYEGEDPQAKALLRKETQMSFGDFLKQHYLPSLRAAGKNAADAEKMLAAQVGWLWSRPIASIRLPEIKGWQNQQAMEKTKATANRYTNAVKAVTNYAKYLGIVDSDPLADFHRISVKEEVHEIRWLTKEEEAALRRELSKRDFSRYKFDLTDVEQTSNGGLFLLTAKNTVSLDEMRKKIQFRYFKDHLTPAVLLMLECGLRRQEALKLRWSDIKPTNHNNEFQLFINPKSEKTRKGRYVPLLRQTLAVLLAWKEDQTKNGVESEYVFPHRNTGKPLGSIDTAWDNLIRNATKHCKSLNGLNVKDLRSTYGSNLVQKGQPIFIVSKLLGHSSVTITERHYAALSDEGKRAAVDTLSTLPKGVKTNLILGSMVKQNKTNQT